MPGAAATGRFAAAPIRKDATSEMPAVAVIRSLFTSVCSHAHLCCQAKASLAWSQAGYICSDPSAQPLLHLAHAAQTMPDQEMGPAHRLKGQMRWKHTIRAVLKPQVLYPALTWFPISAC